MPVDTSRDVVDCSIDIELTSTPAVKPIRTQKPVQADSSRQLKSLVLFAFWGSLYILPFMRLFLVGSDEGTLDYGAIRVAHGQVFARDFFEVIGPGTFYWLAGFFKVFGETFLASRICLFLTSIGTALAMYFLSLRICRTSPITPSILLAATCFGGLWPAISHHVDSNFFALAAVVCMVLWQERGNRSLLLMAGSLAGATTCFLQPKGLLLFCAFLVWLFVLKLRRAASLSAMALLTGSYLTVLAAVALYFWHKGALSALIYVNFIWPSQHYSAVNSVPYAHDIVSNFWDHWVVKVKGFGWTVPMAAVLITPLLFVIALPGLLAALGARFRWNLARNEILLYWLAGAALWLSEIHRKDVTHLVFGSPLLMILGVHFLDEYRAPLAVMARRVLLVSSASLGIFNLLCLLLASHSVTTRAGTIRTFKTMDVFAALEKYAAPGEEIFAYPYAPRYYFLDATTNPTPYSILVYNYNTPSQFQETVRILEERKVRYVVWDKNIEQVASVVFPSSTQVAPGDFIVEPYLKSHYRLVQVVDGFRIMERIER